jgi:hypothetical protein
MVQAEYFKTIQVNIPSSRGNQKETKCATQNKKISLFCYELNKLIILLWVLKHNGMSSQ